MDESSDTFDDQEKEDKGTAPYCKRGSARADIDLERQDGEDENDDVRPCTHQIAHRWQKDA